MSQCARAAFVMFAGLALVPTMGYVQQASITGVVRDPSRAVLPGVTVEATSPALIEGVRSAVSDGTGRYRIELLRPGDYVVTFMLPGFALVRREGIQLTGTEVSTVNAGLRVGELQETITVTGEAPTVDVQSPVSQRVLDRDVLEGLPSSRAPAQVAAFTHATSAVVGPSLGRPLAVGTSNVPVALVAPRSMYGERMNQLDLRFGKVLQSGGTRPNVGVDLYNALNSHAALAVNDAFASWLQPTEILNARFAKVVLQLNF